MLHHRDAPPQVLRDPLLAGTGGAVIHPYMRDLRKMHGHAITQDGDGGTVLQVSSMHARVQDQSLRIDQQMARTSTDVLAAIIPAHATHTGRLDRLASHDGSRWVRRASSVSLCPFPQRRVALLPGAIQSPVPPIMKDRFPRREIARQQAPGYPLGPPAADDIEHRIQNLTATVSPWSSARLAFGQIWLHNRPFGIRQVGIIALLLHTLQRTKRFLRQFLVQSRWDNKHFARV